MSRGRMNRKLGYARMTVLSVALAFLALSWNIVATPAGATISKATGKPIPVLVLGTFSVPGSNAGLPEVRDAILAAVDAINAAGGIHGRPIKAIVCDDQENPNLGEQCSEQAVSDGIVASLGAEPASFAGVAPILKAAKVGNLGDALTDPVSLTDPDFFSTAGGPIAVFAGMPEALAARGAKKIAFIYPGNLGTVSTSFLNSVTLGAKIAKVKLVSTVPIPYTTTDFAPAVATAMASGANGIVTYMPGSGQVSLMKAVNEADPSMLVAAGSFALLPSDLKVLGTAGDGMSVVGLGAQPTSNLPIAKEFRADMKKYYPSNGLSLLTDQGFVNWIAVEQFRNIAEGLKTITPSSVLKAFNHITAYNSSGFLPTVNLTTPCTSCGSYTRMFAPYVSYLTIRNSVLVQSPAGVFHNVYTGKNVSAK